MGRSAELMRVKIAEADVRERLVGDRAPAMIPLTLAFVYLDLEAAFFHEVLARAGAFGRRKKDGEGDQDGMEMSCLGVGSQGERQ